MFEEPNAKKSRAEAHFKNYRHSSRHTQNKNVGKWFIYYCLAIKVNKNNSTYTVQMSNYVSDIAYEA